MSLLKPVLGLFIPLLSCLLGPVPAMAEDAKDLAKISDVRRGQLMFRHQPEAESEQLWQLAPSLSTQVDIAVTGPIARASLQQRFSNPNDAGIEASYVFPLPENAAIDAMRIQIGERIIEAEIQEKAQARKTFEQAREQGQRAALLEQHRPNLFTTELSNIPPGAEILVSLEYQQDLQYRDGEFSLRFPMAITPRYVPAPVASEELAEPISAGPMDVSGWQILPGELPHTAELGSAYGDPPANTQIRISLCAGFELGPLVSPYHQVVTRQHHDETVVELADGQVPPDRDFVLRWAPRDSAQLQAAWFVESNEHGEFGLLMLTPPQAVQQHDRARELIFVIDTSGSMGGESIRAARAGLLAGLDRLSPADHFNLIEFDDDAEALFEQPVAANSGNLQLARRRTKSLRADGGTDMREALKLALAHTDQLSEHLRQVVFITDGAVGNEAELMRLIHTRLGDTRLFTVGIGSAPNSHFMTEAAHFGRGSFRYIAQPDEVADAMRALFDQLDRPALTDVELALPVLADALPNPIPDLYAGEPLSIVMKLDAVPASAQLSGNLGQRRWQQSLRLQAASGQTGIGKLWARRKITHWVREGRRGVDAEKVRNAILALALEHHLVSDYTSLVAVDKTPARDPQDPLHRHMMKTQLPAGMQVSAARGATPSLAMLLAGLVLMLCSGLLHWLPGRRA